MLVPSISITDIHGNTTTDILTIIPPSTAVEDSIQEHEPDHRPNAIASAREEIHEAVMALAKKTDPFKDLSEKLKTVIDYKPNHSYLYVDDKGNLSYCKMAYHFDQYKVLVSIRAQYDALTAYFEGDSKDAWKALRLAAQFLAGIETLNANYSGYPTFQQWLSAISTECAEFLKESSVAPAIPFSWTLFDLFDLKAESFPTQMVIDRLHRDYGNRLATFVTTYCIGNREVPSIKREVVQGCLIALATNVKREDLTDERPLDYFRKTPKGQSLIDFFGIPLSHETFGIDAAFLKEQNTDTIEAQTIVNEMCVFADMESTHLWHPSNSFEMPAELMLDQLSSLFLTPYNAQLFNTDRYLSFLTAAATSLAYLQSCKNNASEIEHKIRPLVYLIESLLEDHADKMYKTNTDQYADCWNKLKNALNAALLDPTYDFMPYYRSLFAHPLLPSDRKHKVYESHEYVQSSEFLARKVGYWNRYYLGNSKYTDKDGLITAHAHCDFRLGALFHLSENEEMVLYEVKELIHEQGFVCQICVPYSIEGYVKEGKSIPIKLVFQGTIDNPKSKGRDLNRVGPGYTVWNDKGGYLFSQNLDTIFKEVIAKYPTAKLSIEFTGHSLGGADASNATTFLMEFYNDQFIQAVHKDIIDHLSGINVHTFNSAGIPMESIDRYNASIGKSPTTTVRHQFVQMDVVEISGQAQLGANAKNSDNIEITEVHNLGASIAGKHCLYAHTRTDTIIPRKILDSTIDAVAFNSYFFGIGHSWSDLSKHTLSIIKERPVMNIAYNSLYLAGMATIQAHTTPLRVIGTPINHFIDQRTSAARKEAWDSACILWQGKQLLEQ